MDGTYQSDGVKLAYRETGTGLPVVFLHPTPLDGEFWRPLIDDLAGVRAIVPDLRGHGKSELGTLPAGGFATVPGAPVLTMAQLASDLLVLLDHLKVPTALFAGCSIGGYVLLELWRRAPERMRGLAFICSKPQSDAEANVARRVTSIDKARGAGSQAALQEMTRTQIKSLIGASALERRPEILTELSAQMTLTAEALVAVQAGLATRPDSVPTVATTTVPVLAIAGGEDSGITPAEMEKFHAAPGGCEFHLLSDAGHFAAYEQPRKVAALLAEWMRQLEV
ncbi:MAG: alpha/beta hydrolase [Terracidiphilus sp.]|jgi:pimeloyl-ACP methyl ester carboxylesterase